MQYKCAKLLAIVVHENMKLGDNTLNNERLSLVNTKFPTNKQKKDSKNNNKKTRKTRDRDITQ